jgi:hypothetical protein
MLTGRNGTVGWLTTRPRSFRRRKTGSLRNLLAVARPCSPESVLGRGNVLPRTCTWGFDNGYFHVGTHAWTGSFESGLVENKTFLLILKSQANPRIETSGRISMESYGNLWHQRLANCDFEICSNSVHSVRVIHLPIAPPPRGQNGRRLHYAADFVLSGRGPTPNPDIGPHSRRQNSGLDQAPPPVAVRQLRCPALVLGLPRLGGLQVVNSECPCNHSRGDRDGGLVGRAEYNAHPCRARLTRHPL